MKRSALVIGGQGVLGTFVARGLAEEGWEVQRGGRREEDRPDFRLVDLDRPETVTAATSEVDLVINCVPETRLTAERTVLRDGGLILNIASLPLAARIEFEGERGPGLVILHGGLTPGVTTLVFKALLSEHPQANALEYAWASTAMQSSGAAGAALIAQQLGRPGRRSVKSVDFPDPIGRRTCIEWGRGEEGWFGGLAEQYRCRSWLYLGPPPAMAGIRTLNRLGAVRLLSPRLLSIGRSRVPESASQEPKRDIVAVFRDGDRLGGYAMNGQGDYDMTVGATLALVEALMERRADLGLSGVYGAETLFDFAELRPRLKPRGVDFVELPSSS